MLLVLLSARDAVGALYPSLREVVAPGRANVKLLAVHPGEGPGPAGSPPLPFEDLGAMRGLPSMSVIVPGDGPTVRTVVRQLPGIRGPVYVRVSEGPLPPITSGRFELGRANELRPGSDLTLVAIGSLLAPAVRAAEELARVGVAARVLDFASVKPPDTPALVRAARETGALLVLEAHQVETGLGTLVAAAVAESYPVPVRRIGVPDLSVLPAGSAGNDGPGTSYERILDEVWELLRLRGKVQ